MQIAVVYIPRNDDRLGKQAFHYPARPLAKGRKEIDMEVLPLEKGTNFVEEEVWELMRSHGVNQSEVDRMTENRSLVIHKPDAEEPVGSTSDFTDLRAVRDIVENCTPNHKRWLEVSLARDSRSQVFTLISAQLEKFEEAKQNRKQQISFNV